MKWSSGLVIVLLAGLVVLLLPISSEFRSRSAMRLEAQKKRIEAVAAGDKALEDRRFEVALAAYRRGLNMSQIVPTHCVDNYVPKQS